MKLICDVYEDYWKELCEAFKKKPMGGIPTHRAWALLEGLKNGIPIDDEIDTKDEFISKRDLMNKITTAFDEQDLYLPCHFRDVIEYDLPSIKLEKGGAAE